MGGKRLYTVSALLSLGTLASCAVDTNEPATGPKVVSGDWGDPNKYPELGGAYSSLTAALGTCVFTAKTGAVQIDLTGAAQTVVVAKRSADSLLLVNGDEKFCTDSVTSAATTVSTKTIKTVNITDPHASNIQNVVLDFLAGTFGAGAKGKAGITVDLGGGATDTLAIRGTSGKDTFAAGNTGVAATSTSFAINSDAFGDIDMLNIEKLTVSLAEGDDVFTGNGGTGTGSAYTTALTVFGGADKDTLTGGDGNDFVYGGVGDDTITGGPGNDALNGDEGDDVITQGAAPDGADVIVCGPGYKDKVSYALRGDLTNGATEKIKVTVGTPWDDDADLTTADDPAVIDVPFLPNDGDVAGAGEKDDVGTSCEILVGGMGDDVLIGDDSTTKGHATDTNLMGDTIYGGAGNDTLAGGQGNDFLYGEAGNDTFDETKQGDSDQDGVLDIVYNAQATTGQDTFVGGEGIDLVDYSLRTAGLTVVMDGDPKSVLTVLPLSTTAKNDGESLEYDNVCTDVEKLYGGNGNDKLTGNEAANTIRGGAGNDELYGLGGNDMFDDQTGWDTSVVDATTPAATDDTLTSGNDKFVGGAGVDTIDYSLRNAPLDCDMVGNATTASANDGISGETDDVFDDVENLLGGLDTNDITGNDLENVIIGGPVVDQLRGGKGNDTLDGKADDDLLLDGGEGNDLIDGGSGQVAGLTTCGLGDDVAYNSIIADGDVSCEIVFP